MKMIKLLFVFIILSAQAARASESSPPVFPQMCQENCVTPFGAKLGATSEGIESYSNCQAKCVYENPNLVEGIFAGIQWQCVEFARRWLMVNKALKYESIDVAADLWNKINHLVNIKTGTTVSLKNNTNGSAVLPKNGDLLIYGREYLETGHVAIVLRTDAKKKLVYVGEQNFSNGKWPGKYARAIPFVRQGNGYWLLDAHLIGWKSY
jgi:hypothetical protein